MKIFITGGEGLLGSALSFEMVKEHKVICGCHSGHIGIRNDNFSYAAIDITRIDSLGFIGDASPEVIIHAAALTDLEFCERNPAAARRVNVKGTENVIRVAKKCGAKLVYF